MIPLLTLLLMFLRVRADGFCARYGSPEVVDDLLTRTRALLPSSFRLPDRTGLIAIYSANLTNLNTFERSPERQILCGADTVQVPVVWYRKPTGRFMASGRLLMARKVYEVTIGILEANLLIQFHPTEEGANMVATLKTLSITRLSRIQVKLVGFGLIGKIVGTVTTLLIGFFEAMFRAFMEDNLRDRIEESMVKVPVLGGFFWGDEDEEEEDFENFPGTRDEKPGIFDEKENEDFELIEPTTRSPPAVPTPRTPSVKDDMEGWRPEEDVEVFKTREEVEQEENELEEMQGEDPEDRSGEGTRGNKGWETEREFPFHLDPRLTFPRGLL